MMDTFDSEKFLSELDILSKEIMPGCGLVFELYQHRLSAAIDKVVARLPEEQHAQAFELARKEFDYLSAKEIAEEIRNGYANGYCCHGFDRDCCPLGCGDLL